MPFGQLIEYYVRDMFLGNSYTKCDGETFPRPFPKKSKQRFRGQVEGCWNILKLSGKPLALIAIKSFKKQK